MSNQNPQRIHGALYGYDAIFDAEALIMQFAATDQVPEKGVLKNFLGTRLEACVFPAVLDDRMGKVEPRPAPGNRGRAPGHTLSFGKRRTGTH